MRRKRHDLASQTRFFDALEGRMLMSADGIGTGDVAGELAERHDAPIAIVVEASTQSGSSKEAQYMTVELTPQTTPYHRSDHSPGDPTTVADDVIVDGRIITAENFDSASLFEADEAVEQLAQSVGRDTSDADPQANGTRDQIYFINFS